MKAPILGLAVATAAFAGSSIYLWQQLDQERTRAAAVEQQAHELGTRLAEVFLMVGGAAALYFAHVPSLLLVIFLMGLLATIFGPLKYSLMPQHLLQSELVGGNALVDSGTFVAILIGTIAGGLLAPTSHAERSASVSSSAETTAVQLTAWRARCCR